MNPCTEFRDALERTLEGRARPERLVPLSWDGHLLSCSACRELLESEQALEVLLASWPEPNLPDELAHRLLERLRRERTAPDLDRLLDRAPAPAPPEGLSARVLAGVEPARRVAREEAALDRLLDAVPAPLVPPGLAEGVLAHVRATERRERLALVRTAALLVPVAAALVAAVLWFTRDAQPDATPGAGNLVIEDGEPLDEELVAAFDVLENWEYLHGEDVDLLLASIDELDELLFEASEWDQAADADAPATAGG